LDDLPHEQVNDERGYLNLVLGEPHDLKVLEIVQSFQCANLIVVDVEFSEVDAIR
jgi:hypothetical protein